MSAQDLLTTVALREHGEGRSRFGGDGPALPGLTFIAALDLAELPHLDPLPASGTLRFYWNLEFLELERMDFVVASRVLHDPGPAPEIANGTPLAGKLVTRRRRLPAPAAGHLARHPGPGPRRDRVLVRQGFPKTRERYSEAELQGEGWSLLAQFASSGELMFGDMGDLYYVLPTADLKAHRFDRAMGIMQCT